MEYLNQFIDAVMPYVITIVTAIAGYVAVKIKNKYEEKANTDTKKQIVEDTVKYVQQVYETLDGTEKFQKAVSTATEWLNEKGLSISEAELAILIESAVKGFKDSWTSTPAVLTEGTVEETVEEVTDENK